MKKALAAFVLFFGLRAIPAFAQSNIFIGGGSFIGTTPAYQAWYVGVETKIHTWQFGGAIGPSAYEPSDMLKETYGGSLTCHAFVERNLFSLFKKIKVGVGANFTWEGTTGDLVVLGSYRTWFTPTAAVNVDRLTMTVGYGWGGRVPNQKEDDPYDVDPQIGEQGLVLSVRIRAIEF